MMSTHVQQARFLLTLLDPVYFIPFPVRLRMDFTDLKKKKMMGSRSLEMVVLVLQALTLSQ